MHQGRSIRWANRSYKLQRFTLIYHSQIAAIWARIDHLGAITRELTSDSHSVVSFSRFNHFKFQKINSCLKKYGVFLQRNNFININMTDGLASLRSLTRYADPELHDHLRLLTTIFSTLTLTLILPQP